MSILLQELLEVVDEDAMYQKLLDIATALGFNATSWQDGSYQKTILKIMARAMAATSIGVSDIAAGGYNDLAEDTWLYLYADSNYDNQVYDAKPTTGICVLTSTVDAPSHPISDIIAVSTPETGSVRFRSQTTGTLTPGGTLSITFQAETPGSSGNVPNGSIIELETPLAGVSITNPAQVLQDTWVNVGGEGADIETDEQLRTRNRTKWATLGIGPGMAYAHNALKADSAVKRVFVDDQNPRGPGTLDIYLASDSGPSLSITVTAVDNYLRGVTDGVDRVNTSADLLVLAATQKNIIFTATVYILKQNDTTTNRALVESAVIDYFKNLRIGGTPLEEGGTGAVRVSAILGAIMSQATGVQNVAFNITDVDLLRYEVAVPVVSFQYRQI